MDSRLKETESRRSLVIEWTHRDRTLRKKIIGPEKRNELEFLVKTKSLRYGTILFYGVLISIYRTKVPETYVVPLLSVSKWSMSFLHVFTWLETVPFSWKYHRFTLVSRVSEVRVRNVVF